jgi:hypothetical protein
MPSQSKRRGEPGLVERMRGGLAKRLASDPEPAEPPAMACIQIISTGAANGRSRERS